MKIKLFSTPVRHFSAEKKMSSAFKSQYPLLFDSNGLMKIYECSGKSKKLKVYKWVPTIFFPPLLYLTFGNYYALYKLGFSFFGLFKSLGWTTLLLTTMSINGNLQYNSKTLLDTLSLHRDGSHVKTVMINGKVQKHPISCMKPVNPDQL